MNNESSYSVTKRITILSILIAMACVLSLFDKYISRFVINALPIGAMAPGFKLGIANIVILYIIYNFKFTDSLVAVLLKSVIGGFVFGSIINFFIGFTGTILSFFAMYLLLRALKKPIHLIIVSAVGGVVHAIGQVLAVLIVYRVADILLYSPYIIMMGLLTGIIVGALVMTIQKAMHSKSQTKETNNDWFINKIIIIMFLSL